MMRSSVFGLFVFLGLFFSSQTYCQPASEGEIAGRVTDSFTGVGLPGVPVSDGFHIVLTDAEGRYRFARNGRRQVLFCIIPSEYEIPINPETGLPAHFGGPDFVLTRLSEPLDEFDVIAVGDPQSLSERQTARYSGETLPDIQHSAGKGTIVFALGDIVSDSEKTWEPMFKAVNGLKNSLGEPLPYYTVVGNHDSDRYEDPVDSSIVRFEKYYGPRNFSFNRGNVHFVVMDNIFRTKVKAKKSLNGLTWSYEGGFSEEQYQWLKEDFACVSDKASKTLVFLCHIPLHESVIKHRRQEFLNAFTQFGQAHILCGHNHRTDNRTYDDFVCKGGTPVYSHTHVAAGGDVWFSSLAKDGTPNGYGVYSFSNGNLRNWRFKATGKDPSLQFEVYDGNDSYALSDGTLTCWADSLRNAFIVDVWNDDAKHWKVELFSGKKKLGEFRKIEGKAFNPVKYRTVEADVAARKWGSLNGWNKGGLCHFWIFVPKSGKPSSVKNWEVRATQIIPGTGNVNVYSKRVFTK